MKNLKTAFLSLTLLVAGLWMQQAFAQINNEFTAQRYRFHQTSGLL